MNSGVKTMILVLALSLAGCAGTPAREDHDKESPAEINTRLGLAYLQQGNPEQALAKLNKALEQDPRLAAAHHYLAETYRQLGQLPDAEQHFRKALSLAPRDAAIQNNYGVFLCDESQYEKADEMFLKAARDRNNRSAAEAYENAGLCALREPDVGRAEERFRDALRLSANRPKSLYQMVELSVADKRYLEARAFLQRYLGVAAHDPRSLWLGIRIERELGAWAVASDYGKLLVEGFPGSEEAKMYQELAEKN
jgi:type IV pilus assembly protein PilF